MVIMPPSAFDILRGIGEAIISVFSVTWWFVLPLALGSLAWKLYTLKNTITYIRNMKWVVLRIRTPKEILKTPKAMEQIFSAAHATYSFNIPWWEKKIKGKVEEWQAYEIVGDANGVYFYIRVTEGTRNLIESAIYSEYPSAEIEQVPDYILALPVSLPNETVDIFGTEFILAREDAYPIRTYIDFDAREAEEKIDTVATLTEVLSRLKESEQIWIQLIIRPTGDEWKKKAEAERDKIMGRPEKKAETGFKEHMMDFFTNLILAPFRPPEFADTKQDEPKKKDLSKGEQLLVEKIEGKFAKIGFECAIRFIYIDESSKFSRNNIAAVMGALRQINSMTLNSIKPNLDTMTIARPPFKWFLKNRRVRHKKRMIYESYRRRMFPWWKFSVMNTEELATLYHFPSNIVSAPGLHAVDFSKGAPPTNLPTE